MTPESDFRVDAGRAGDVRYEGSKPNGVLPFELSVGPTAMFVFGLQCYWDEEPRRAMARSEVESLVRQFAAEHEVQVDIDFGDDPL